MNPKNTGSSLQLTEKPVSSSDTTLKVKGWTIKNENWLSCSQVTMFMCKIKQERHHGNGQSLELFWKVFPITPFLKLDGSGHITRHNRQFLRRFTPFSQPSTSSPLNTTSSMSTPEISSLWMDAIDTPLQIASHMLPHSVSSISSLSPPPHDLEGASSTPGWSASAMGYPNPATVIGDQSWA